MCELFGRERSVITKHIRNVFNEGELERDSVCAKFARTVNDGNERSSSLLSRWYLRLNQHLLARPVDRKALIIRRIEHLGAKGG